MSKLDPQFIPRGAFCCGYVAPRGVDPQSVIYATQHREWHVARFPASTPETLANLDKLIAQARSKGAA